MARAIVSRLLHEPTLRLKGAGEHEPSYRHVHALRELFGARPGAASEAPAAEVTELDVAPPAPQVIRLGHARQRAGARAGRHVAALLGDEVELVEITTSGDRGCVEQDKARFVKEIEEALLAGAIDLAVHSAKDVPAELPDGCAIVGVPAARRRRATRCCGGASRVARDGAAARAGAVVGTASVRRRSQLLALRPDLDVEELRGNVDTRLRRLAEGDYDAIVLAAAGLARLGRAGEGGRAARRARPVPRPGLPGARGPRRRRAVAGGGRRAHRPPRRCAP